MTNNGKNDLPVYRRINGDFVRIPGDKTDPNRRYTHISGGEKGAHLLEFTDEEEKQRNLDEAQWNASQPQREEQERIEKENFNKFKESLKYETRYIAFLDILGWGNALISSQTDAELTKELGIAIHTIQMHNQLVEWMDENLKDPPGTPRITHFSDSIILSTDLRYGNKQLLFHLSGIITNLLQLGFFVRGGITKGLLIHQHSMVYGPGLVKAHELESKYAVSARVLLDEELQNEWQGGQKIFDLSGQIVDSEKLWRLDSDGKRFFDFLQPPAIPGESLDIELAKLKLLPVKNLIDSWLKKEDLDKHIRKKYLWLAEYFNSILLEHREIELDQIIVL